MIASLGFGCEKEYVISEAPLARSRRPGSASVAEVPRACHRWVRLGCDRAHMYRTGAESQRGGGCLSGVPPSFMSPRTIAPYRRRIGIAASVSCDHFLWALMDRDEAWLRLRAALIALIGGEPFAAAGVPRRPRSPSRPDAAALRVCGGGRGIRTPGGSDTTAVFKFVPGAFGHARKWSSRIQFSAGA
jgi:hypothetical protein